MSKESPKLEIVNKQAPEYLMVTASRFVNYTGEIGLVTFAVSLFIPWAYQTLYNHDEIFTHGDEIFQEGHRALFWIGVALMMIAGVHLIKHCINEISDVKSDETLKNLGDQVIRWFRNVAGFSILSVGFICLGLVCFANSDLFRSIIGKNAQFPRLDNMDSSQKIRLLMIGIVCIGLYMLVRDTYWRYKTAVKEKDTGSRLRKVYNYRFYHAVSIICLLIALSSFSATIGLYYKNFNLTNNVTNHQMLSLICIGIAALIVHYLMKIPKHIATHVKDDVKANNKKLLSWIGIVIACCILFPLIISILPLVLVYFPNSRIKQPASTFIQKTSLCRRLTYIPDFFAIIAAMLTLSYLIPALLYHSDTLTESKFFTQRHNVFCLMGIALIVVGVIHIIYQTAYALSIPYNDGPLKKTFFKLRDIVGSFILSIGFFCIAAICLHPNLSTNISHHLLLVGITLIFTHMFIKESRLLLNSAINKFSKKDTKLEPKVENLHRWIWSFLFLSTTICTSSVALGIYQSHANFANHAANQQMSILLIVGMASATMYVLMKLIIDLKNSDINISEKLKQCVQSCSVGCLGTDDSNSVVNNAKQEKSQSLSK